MNDVARVLSKAVQESSLSLEELSVLLKSEDLQVLESMAQLARVASIKHFGKNVSLYTPLYLSNYCLNGCRYCNYSVEHHINRKKLSQEEILEEAKVIETMGLSQVLLLTGESERHFDLKDLLEAITLIKPCFDQISVETYAMTVEDYQALAAAGVYGVTLYQETYDQRRYRELHPFGPKSDFDFRLTAPDRVGLSGLRQFNMGILLGLSDWQEDLLALIAHARRVQQDYPHLEIGFSLPRMIPFEGANFQELGIHPVSDRDFIKAICCLRLAMPSASIGLSTRETFNMRMHTLPIGINKMSAGVSTEVGGRSQKALGDVGAGQFPISDESTVFGLWQEIEKRGYQPILQDWIKF